MRLYLVLAFMSCAAWKSQAYPAYYPYYGPNVDALSYGADGESQRAMVMSRYYQPYYPRSAGGGMAAFMFGQPQEASKPTREDYYLPDRRRQTPEVQYLPPQQNEVYPQIPEKIPLVPTEQTEIAEPTERVDLIPTTAKTELAEPDVEEVEEATPQPKKRVSKKKQVKKPIDDDDEEEDYAPKMPAGAFFPMFFGWGSRSGGGGPGGAMAVANAYSTGRGGVASSHATAYGAPRPEERKTAQ
ncbi:hypothetical protein EVAR_10895_1 [Eumeta japonica]|uniref:Translation initiation factor IF-2 n=1 Tax=Eumeta variegata TaxID=151549 RepID=A0A4C1URY4_EUMVA|nr:hypothetical protein EVAR_10895_1 [Eumeta japonica]